MIHTLACSITYFFEKRGLLEEKNKDICCYGLEIIISTICGMMSILLLAFLLGNFTFGMWYLLYIVPIRTCVRLLNLYYIFYSADLKAKNMRF